MSEQKKDDKKKNKKDENDQFDFFKLSGDNDEKKDGPGGKLLECSGIRITGITDAAFQTGDQLYVFIRQLKIEHPQVFLNPGGGNGFGQRNKAHLQAPADADLRNASPVFD